MNILATGIIDYGLQHLFTHAMYTFNEMISSTEMLNYKYGNCIISLNIKVL